MFFKRQSFDFGLKTLLAISMKYSCPMLQNYLYCTFFKKGI